MVNLNISLKWKDFFLLFVVATELMALIFKIDIIHLSIKPFIIPSLILVFLKKSFLTTKQGKWLLFALLFSFFGDVFLLFEGEVWFLLGLSAFLIAHLFYTFLFFKISRPIKLKILHAVIISFYSLFLSFLLYIIWDSLEKLLIPVIIYGFTITIMAVLAGFSTINTGKIGFLFGSLFFVFSDSIIAVSKFLFIENIGYNFPFFIMLTYIVAQFLLVNTISNYIKSPFKN
jgi:uncharacterized membrane protein YhhN